MSSMSLANAAYPWSPVPRFFKDTFEESIKRENPVVTSVAGLRAGDMNDFEIRESLTIDHGYLICEKEIDFTVSDFIKGTSGLILGSSVSLDAPVIEFVGTEENPMQIVAYNSITINTLDLKIKNLTIKVIKGAVLTINATEAQFDGNFKIIQFKLTDDHYIETTLLSTENQQDLIEYMEKKPKT